MFVDTNILVNARIREAPHHDSARANLERVLRGPEPLCISRQVMREYLAVVTRPHAGPVPITRGEALDDIRRLEGAFQVLEDGARVAETLVSLCREVAVGGRQISRRQHSGHHAGPRASAGCLRSMPRFSDAMATVLTWRSYEFLACDGRINLHGEKFLSAFAGHWFETA